MSQLYDCTLIPFQCIFCFFSCVELNLGDKTASIDGLSNNTTPLVENEAVPNEQEPACKLIDDNNIRVGESAAEQYWERFVLGINRAALGELTVDLNR